MITFKWTDIFTNNNMARTPEHHKGGPNMDPKWEGSDHKDTHNMYLEAHET